MIDLQWPHALRPDEPFVSYDAPPDQDSVRAIELFFEQRTGRPAVLVPSGRAAISMILRLHGINRTHTVFAPPWSSTCVWNAIVPYANPTTTFSAACDVVLAVHKWGGVQRIEQGFSGLVIEDSVDSIYEPNACYFPNQGAYEIISLPKTIGSYTGGILLVRQPEAAEELRARTREFSDLSTHQSRLRYLYATGNGPTGPEKFYDWHHLEHLNTALDRNAVHHIAQSLKHWEINARTIRSRLAVLAADPVLSAYGAATDRLPPVVTIPLHQLVGPLDPEVRILNRNLSPFLDRPQYERVGVIPIHFGVSDPQFNALVSSVRRSLRV